MPALGEEFRSAREARGLTLSDVAEQIHIRSVYLNAIENEDWPSIGAPVYVRGFIRTYARFLGIEPEGAVQRFNETIPADRPAAAPQPVAVSARAQQRTRPSIWAILGTLVALALVAFVGFEWWQFSSARGGRVATQPSRGTPVSPHRTVAESSAMSRPTARPTPPLAHHQLAIRLTQRSWVRVVVDGHNELEGIFPAGTSRTFTGSVADLRVGNAGGVAVSVNGAPARTLGGVGDVVEQRFPL
jgi:cytoskeletal protein RodZ